MPRIRMPNGSIVHYDEQTAVATPEDGSPAFYYAASYQYVREHTLPSGYYGSFTYDATVPQETAYPWNSGGYTIPIHLGGITQQQINSATQQAIYQGYGQQDMPESSNTRQTLSGLLREPYSNEVIPNYNLISSLQGQAVNPAPINHIYKMHQKLKINKNYSIPDYINALCEVIFLYDNGAYRVLMKSGPGAGSKTTIQENELTIPYKRNLPSWW